MRRLIRSAPWGDADFRRLWVAETVSQTGTQVSVLALPLIAIVALDASATSVGLLAAAATAPVLLVGLPARAFLDRHRRKPVLVMADIGRAAAMGSVPMAWVLGVLNLTQLYVVAFVCGALTVCADVAAQALLPSVVGRDGLAGANGSLEVARSAAQVAGPGLAGGLVALAGAPLAVAVDAISFGVSAVCVAGTDGNEGVRAPAPAARACVRADVVAGLRFVARHPLLRPIAACSAVSNLGSSMFGTVVVLFMVDTLELGPGAIGVLLAVGNVGLVVGALLATRLAARYVVGPVIAGSLAIGTPFSLLVPLAPASLAVPALVLAQVAAGLRGPIYNVNQISLRQAITPPELLGRMTASMRVLVLGTMPVGALAGGVVAGMLGVRAALLLGAIVGCAACGFTMVSPVRSVRSMGGASVSSNEPDHRLSR